MHFGERQIEKMFAEATKKAAGARFKKRQVDSEGQEIEVRCVLIRLGSLT